MKAELKIPGGKLIRVECEADTEIIHHIKITGDFFLHPEEGIETLEAALTGVPADENVIREKVSSFFKGDYILIGATPGDLVKAIRKALPPKK